MAHSRSCARYSAELKAVLARVLEKDASNIDALRVQALYVLTREARQVRRRGERWAPS